MMESDAKIYVAGHTGLVGAAILYELKRQGYSNLLFRTHGELDLRDQVQTNEFFESEKPDYVIVGAATVGGVEANRRHPAKFFFDNILIGVNIINAAYEYGAKKLLYMGSSCIYPRNAPQPMKEDLLLTGKVEPTNEAYAMAKLACLKMCEYYNREYNTNFISCMPCNAYGPGDDFDPLTSHVVAALIRKFHEAKESKASEVVIWGTGKPLREFIFIEDIADAAVFLMNNYSDNETINVGTGTEYTIGALAQKIKKIVGYEGEIKYNLSMSDGSPRKLIDSSKIFSMGWRPKVSFDEGIKKTYQDYVNNIDRYNGGREK